MNVEELVQEIKDLMTQRADFIRRMRQEDPDHAAFLEQLNDAISQKHQLFVMLLELPQTGNNFYCGEGWT